PSSPPPLPVPLRLVRGAVDGAGSTKAIAAEEEARGSVSRRRRRRRGLLPWRRRGDRSRGLPCSSAPSSPDDDGYISRREAGKLVEVVALFVPPPATAKASSGAGTTAAATADAAATGLGVDEPDLLRIVGLVFVGDGPRRRGRRERRREKRRGAVAASSTEVGGRAAVADGEDLDARRRPHQGEADGLPLVFLRGCRGIDFATSMMRGGRSFA
ncbi:hypothetical protein ACHAWF_005536, partial [Thalassiosira exigua]